MRSWNRTRRALVTFVVLIAPAMAFGQSTGPNARLSMSSPHRPWVGVSLGTGFLGGENVEPDDSRDLGVSLDIPLQPTFRLRAGAGRMRVNGARFGEFPLRRLTFDAVALVPFASPGRSCQSHFVVGGGFGLYHYGLDNDFSKTRGGYQVFAGGECVGSRVSIGLEITGRSIRGPANLQLPDLKLFAADMRLGSSCGSESAAASHPFAQRPMRDARTQSPKHGRGQLEKRVPPHAWRSMLS